jgi:aminoglycoside/choline kinase family phosphotransferase
MGKTRHENHAMNRAVEIASFLAQNGWDTAQQTPLEADFSPRRFARLEHSDGRRAILMDADPDQKTPQFLVIAKLLRGLDISAPEIFAADPARGLVLMEDFGDCNVGRMLDEGAEAKPIYRRAVDVLVHLHRHFDAQMARGLDLPAFGGALFSAQAELFLDAYFPYVKEREAALEEYETFRAAWKEALKGIEALPQTLMLRDFMPDNLMDSPNRKNWQSVGVLDFQDGGFGPIAYDIASLCEVVRRGGGDAMLNDMIAYYHEQAKPALPIKELTRACHILAAQRHMRILGIIARLAHKGRPEKLAYMPRIKAYLGQLLQDEALKPVQKWIRKYRVFT